MRKKIKFFTVVEPGAYNVHLWALQATETIPADLLIKKRSEFLKHGIDLQIHCNNAIAMKKGTFVTRTEGYMLTGKPSDALQGFSTLSVCGEAIKSGAYYFPVEPSVKRWARILNSVLNGKDSTPSGAPACYASRYAPFVTLFM